MTDTVKAISLVVILAIVSGVIYAIFSNSSGNTTVDPVTQTHGGAGSTILCVIYPPACKA